MSTNSAIEWTEATWNPVAGCSLVSPGCTNCYAMKMAARLEAMGQAKYAGLTKKVNGRAVWTGKINLDESALLQPLSWKKPRRVFVNSMSDLFHPDVPVAFIVKVFAVAALTPEHTYQVLTKRPELMQEVVTAGDFGHLIYQQVSRWLDEGSAGPLRHRWDDAHALAGVDTVTGAGVHEWTRWKLPLDNVWLGTSVEDQARADERIPHLLRCPAAVRFLSCEPLLGPVDLTEVNGPNACTWNALRGLNNWNGRVVGGIIEWVIVGGESGPGAREMDVAWARSLVAQCKAAGVPVFMKQMGSNPQWHEHREWVEGPLNGRYVLKDPKGGNPDEWEPGLRVREFPEVAPAGAGR